MTVEPHDQQRRPHHRPTLVVMIVGLLVLVGLFAKHAWTRFANMAMVAKPSEAVGNLQHIQQAQIAYFEAHGEYLAVGATPRRVPGQTQTAFESEHMDGWTRLGWQPDSLVRCQYEVTVPTPTNLRAVARCDADGDGNMSVFVSSRENPPMRTSPNEQY